MSGSTSIWREQFRKPVVDECGYEGNIAPPWRNLAAEEMVHRFWEGAVHGGYVGHGETYLDPEDILWWAKGGILHGKTALRLVFLRDMLADSPSTGLEPVELFSSWSEFPSVGKPHTYYLTYFGRHQPAQVEVHVPEGAQYRGEVIDTWDMTTTAVEEAIVDGSVVQLPGTPIVSLLVHVCLARHSATPLYPPLHRLLKPVLPSSLNKEAPFKKAQERRINIKVRLMNYQTDQTCDHPMDIVLSLLRPDESAKLQRYIMSYLVNVMRPHQKEPLAQEG